MRFVRHLSPSMIHNREGTVINIGDVEALRPDPGQAAYAASKHALHGWSASIYHVRCLICSRINPIRLVML